VPDATDPLEVVRAFCDAWSEFDLETIMGFFSDDAVYHNIPIDPVAGSDAIRATVEMFTAAARHIEFRVLHAVAEGPVVLTERLDVFELPGATIELPVMGTFEVHDGRITAWRDYFDLQQYLSQVPPG
jgi:limonene-1,2-epoxide hydrolase